MRRKKLLISFSDSPENRSPPIPKIHLSLSLLSFRLVVRKVSRERERKSFVEQPRRVEAKFPYEFPPASSPGSAGKKKKKERAKERIEGKCDTCENSCALQRREGKKKGLKRQAGKKDNDVSYYDWFV